MGKWIRKIILSEREERLPPDANALGEHISIEEMAAFIDGNLGADERHHIIHHLNRCETCTELFEVSVKSPVSANEVSETFDGEDKPKNRNRSDEKKRAIWQLKPLYALAASILLVVMVGGNFFYQQLGKSDIIDLSLALDSDFQTLLLENQLTQWQSPERIQKFKELLHSRGVEVKSLNSVVMASAYTQSKSFFKKEENMIIRIEKGVAYIEIVEK